MPGATTRPAGSGREGLHEHDAAAHHGLSASSKRQWLASQSAASKACASRRAPRASRPRRERRGRRAARAPRARSRPGRPTTGAVPSSSRSRASASMPGGRVRQELVDRLPGRLLGIRRGEHGRGHPPERPDGDVRLDEAPAGRHDRGRVVSPPARRSSRPPRPRGSWPPRHRPGRSIAGARSGAPTRRYRRPWPRWQAAAWRPRLRHDAPGRPVRLSADDAAFGHGQHVEGPVDLLLAQQAHLQARRCAGPCPRRAPSSRPWPPARSRCRG